MAKKIVIVGGHGGVSRPIHCSKYINQLSCCKVSLRLTRLLSATATYALTSIIRNPEHSAEIVEAGATPHVLSLEDDDVQVFADIFTGAHVVYFSAGAGGKGGEARTKSVDYEGAIKVFDALERVASEPKPRLILVSAVDLRDTSKGYPAHYVRPSLILLIISFLPLALCHHL